LHEHLSQRTKIPPLEIERKINDPTTVDEAKENTTKAPGKGGERIANGPGGAERQRPGSEKI